MLESGQKFDKIKDVTTFFGKSYDRQKVIEQNKKNAVRHAYFREYLALQRLCLLILRHQKYQIGSGTKQTYGILFDGAWLWEEYINSLITDVFYHPMNKGGRGAQRLFEGNIGLIYPDFISRDNENRIIADTKYKPIDNIGNRDYLQVLAYMFRFDAKAGYYLYPESEETDDLRLRMNQGSTYEKNVTPREDISVTKHGLKQERTVAIMWLKLDIGGIDFHFRISGYKKSTQENWDDEWCDVDLTLQSRKWLDYHINSDETLLALEVEELRDSIDALLKDGLENYEHKECVEPDFEFHLYPKEDLRNNPRFTYVAPGHEILDVHMDFSVTFWDREGCLSSNRLLMEFDRDDLEKLLCYLNLVTKAVSKDDDTVKKAIAEGYIYG